MSLNSSVLIGKAVIMVALSDFPSGEWNKRRCVYVISLPNKGPIYRAADLRVIERDTDEEMLIDGMRALLSFLSACGEAQSYPGSENADLFPPVIAQWAAENSDEIIVAAMDDIPAENY